MTFLSRQTSAAEITFWTVLVLMCFAVGQESFIPRSAQGNRSTPRKTSSPNKVSQIVDAEEVYLSPDEKSKWTHLLKVAQEVSYFMTCQKNFSKPGRSAVTENPTTFLIIYTNELATVMAGLEQGLSCPGATAKAITWSLGVLRRRQELLDVLKFSLDMETDVISVIVASSHMGFIQLVLEIVATDMAFQWRHFRHVTEWFIISTDPIYANSILLRQKNMPDFVTLLSADEFSIVISQKSRVHQMKTVMRIPFYDDCPIYQNHSVINSTLGVHLKSAEQSLVNQASLSGRLRRGPAIYLSTQKSVMAGMHIPVPIVESQSDKMTSLVEEENNSLWIRFNMAILNLLSDSLGFTAQPFAVSDGGYYGTFEPNGDILGVTGYLARREAGLTPMALINTERRRHVIDFLYPSIREDNFYIMYKVHLSTNQLGDPRGELIQTKTDLIFILIGPCIVLVVGLLIYVVNGVLFTKEKIHGAENLRRLYDFPLHWLFQTDEPCHHHSARILRASWGLFCVAMFASYGALLTSHTTAPQEYPRITSLKDLLKHPDFVVGITQDTSFFIADMKEAKQGTILAEVWQILCEFNKSDSRTFSSDKSYHIRRVLEGKYAFLTNIPERMLPYYVDEDFSEVRFKVLDRFLPVTAVPKNVFYKSDLERVLRYATESGIIKYLSEKWSPPQTYLERSNVVDTAIVELYRLEFLIYIVATGGCLAVVSLTAEYLLFLMRVIFPWVSRA